MKKLLLLGVAVLFTASTSFGAEFKPTLLKLQASPVIQYDFDGSTLNIPVQVSGTTAGIVFSVYTRGKASQIVPTTNGHLGWHYVNKVDTCVYYSALKNYGVGANTVTWDGKDQDGGVVAPGDYTYYLWSFDNVSAKTLAVNTFTDNWLWERGVEIQGLTTDGLPSPKPFIYETMPTRRWNIGNDPLDLTLMETTTIPLGAGVSISYGDSQVDPNDFNYVYFLEKNVGAKVAGVGKFKWVPGGTSEVQTAFGNDGLSDLVEDLSNFCPGVRTDGEYLYTADENYISDNEPNADFYIYDMEGSLLSEIDISPWWSSPTDFAGGGQMNGGPNCFGSRGKYVFLTSNGSCLVQMVDPQGYLASTDIEDFIIWGNDNGDYTLDRNFEDTSSKAWVCNDYNAGAFKESATIDANMFFAANSFDVGAVSFGLIGPDGTGFGYFTFAGDTAGWKMGQMFLDNDTPYDGFYMDNKHAGGSPFNTGGWVANEFTGGLFYLGHDSITGILTNAVDVAEAAPATFAVSQNTPNPFNPTTSISFTLAKAGDVTVEVFNTAGQKVATLAQGIRSAGTHSVVWDATSNSSGVYFYTVKSGNNSKTMKMTLVK